MKTVSLLEDNKIAPFILSVSSDGLVPRKQRRGFSGSSEHLWPGGGTAACARKSTYQSGPG